MSWTRRIKHPSEVLKKATTSRRSSRRSTRRTAGSRFDQEFQPNDWQAFKEKHQPGDIVEGAVSRLADFGVFIQIEGLVEGLMHVSETGLPRGEKPQDHFKEGDPVRARILRIDDADMKVGLSAVNLGEGGEPVAAAAEASAGPTPSVAEAPPVEAAPVSSEEAPVEAAPVEAAPAMDDSGAKKKRVRKKAKDAATES
jgi:small subunit ribosomal protein S1